MPRQSNPVSAAARCAAETLKVFRVKNARPGYNYNDYAVCVGRGLRSDNSIIF